MNNNNPKFRVWSRPDNKFVSINSDEYELSFHGDVWFVKKLCQTFEAQLRNTHVVDGVNYVMQQYSGVDTKDGKQVFAGDIVKIKFFNSHDMEVEEYSGPVVFETGLFLFTDKEFAMNDYGFMKEEIEIIGNIFQNPELLK